MLIWSYIKRSDLMNINKQKEIIENVLKESNIVTNEGELIEIHEDIINQISSKIIKTTAEKTVEENEVAKKRNSNKKRHK